MVVNIWMGKDRRPCLLPVGRDWEGDYRLLVFTALNSGVFLKVAWIRGYTCGSKKRCVTPTRRLYFKKAVVSRMHRRSDFVLSVD